MIVKVQVPLATNEPIPRALVYDKKREFDVYMDITDDLIDAMNGEFKAFFEAEYDAETNVTILGKRLPDQGW